jgi:hypothetical protein
MNGLSPTLEMVIKKRMCITLYIILVIGVFLVGCQGSLLTTQERGQRVKNGKEILLSESGQQTGQYRTDDLTIAYRYTRTGNQLQISGTLRFNDPIQIMFSTVNAFSLALILADAQGIVLAQQPLTTANGENPREPVSFSKTVVIPSQTVSFAFSYTGVALGAGSDKSRSNFWDVPF